MFAAPVPSATVRVKVCAEPKPEAGTPETTEGRQLVTATNGFTPISAKLSHPVAPTCARGKYSQGVPSFSLKPVFRQGPSVA